MISRIACAAAMLSLASPLVAVPASAAIARETGALPRGGSYVLYPDPTVGTAAIGLWFRAPGAGYDDATPGLADLAATATAVAPLASGKSLYGLVHTVGGELNIQVYQDIIGIGAVVPASAARRIVAAMTAAYYAPSVDDTAVKTARANAAVLGVQQRYESDSLLHDLLFKQIFATGPEHYPALPTSVTQLTSITTAQVSAFAKRAFRAENSVLTLTGNVDSSSISAVTDGAGPGSMDSPFDSRIAGTPASTTAQAAIDGIGLGWIGPPITDQKAATALDFIADYLFREATGIVSKDLDRTQSDAVVVGQFITLHDPGVMVVTIAGGHEKAVQQSVLDALASLRKPLDEKTFVAAREAFLYHVAADTQTPQQRADNLGWYTVEGDPAYAPGIANGGYEQSARALDPGYVAGIVRRYLSNPVVVDLVTNTPPKEQQPQ